MQLQLLLLPQLLPVTMPIGLFCGMLYAYWRLSTDSELVVMRAAGLSRMRLARPGIMLGCGCAVVVASMTFYFMPLANTTMRDTRFAWHYIYSTLVLREQGPLLRLQAGTAGGHGWSRTWWPDTLSTPDRRRLRLAASVSPRSGIHLPSMAA